MQEKNKQKTPKRVLGENLDPTLLEASRYVTYMDETFPLLLKGIFDLGFWLPATKQNPNWQAFLGWILSFANKRTLTL